MQTVLINAHGDKMASSWLLVMVSYGAVSYTG